MMLRAIISMQNGDRFTIEYSSFESKIKCLSFVVKEIDSNNGIRDEIGEIGLWVKPELVSSIEVILVNE